MDIRQLRYFLAVVEAGSFTGASAQLHISQPPLSVAIAKLETEVNASLLVRTPRGVEPTSAGRYLVGAAHRILADVDDTVAELGRFGEGTAGSLTIAAVPALMWHRIPQLLKRCTQKLPGVELRLTDPPPWAAMDMLEQRTADIAAVMVADPRRFNQRYGSAFDIIDWGEIPLVAALPPEMHDAPEPFPLQDFNGRTVVLPRRTPSVPSLPESVEEAFFKYGVVPGTLQTAPTIQASLPLIESGVAVAVLPDPDKQSLGRFNVTTRTLDPAPRPLRALVLARKEDAGADFGNPVISRVLELISGEKAGGVVP